jgi:LEA14-like dessication related protein
MKLDNITKVKIGVGIFMIGLTAFTINYLLKQVRLLANIKFDVVGTTVSKLSFTRIEIILWWKVTNVSDISFTIKEQTYDVFLNGKFVKKVGSAEPIEVLANGVTRIPTYVVFSPEEAIQVGIDNLGDFMTEAGRKKLKLKVTGFFTVQTKLFALRRVPFEYEDTIHNIMNY